jgi:LytS/YehU family sensor histidine kinase
MQIRYDEALTVSIDVDKKFGQTQIAPFSLQLLIENAMKHNIASLSRPLHILLFNIGDEYIVVQNNLQEKNTSSNSTGIGLNNIMERYKYLFQREVVIEKDLNLFKVKLPIVHL